MKVEKSVNAIAIHSGMRRAVLKLRLGVEGR